MSLFFNRDKRPSLKSSSFLITERGRGQLSMDFSSGSPASRVLIALETAGMSNNLDEIARSANMSIGQVERVLPQLLRSGLVQTSGSEPDV